MHGAILGDRVGGSGGGDHVHGLLDVAFWDEINPGNTVTMPVVFDMPVDAVPASIELHDSMFSGGVTVSLR